MKPQQRSPLIYALRTAAALAGLGLAALLALGRLYSTPHGPRLYVILNAVGVLDVVRSLFYAALPATAIIVLTPIQRVWTMATRPRLVLGLAAAAIAGGPLIFAPLITRPALASLGLSLLPGLYAAANVALLIGLVPPQDGSNGHSRLLRLSWPLSDLLAPTLIWSAHARQGSRLAVLLRLLPGLMVGLMPVLPWVLAPPPIGTPIEVSPLLSQISAGKFYQVRVDDSTGELIAVRDGDQTIVRIDPQTAEVRLKNAASGCGLFLGFAADARSRRLLCLNSESDQSIVLDMDTLQTLAVNPLQPGLDLYSLCRTYWHAQRRLLYSFCEDGLYLLCPDGNSIIAKYPGQPGGSLYDPQRDEIVIAAWFEGLIALDSRTLKPERWLGLPPTVERVALDSRRGRLLASLSMQSSIVVVDSDRFTIQQWLPTIPGVRAMLIDEKRQRLYISGLSPVLEVRSLDDFSLIDRLTVPPWVRNLELDPRGDALYMTTGAHGLWRLDLNTVGRDRWRCRLQRLDPFFCVLRAVSELVDWYMGWSDVDWTKYTPSETQTFRTEPCGDGVWYEDI